LVRTSAIRQKAYILAYGTNQKAYLLVGGTNHPHIATHLVSLPRNPTGGASGKLHRLPVLPLTITVDVPPRLCKTHDRTVGRVLAGLQDRRAWDDVGGRLTEIERGERAGIDSEALLS
jgi:hypothetical protein